MFLPSCVKICFVPSNYIYNKRVFCICLGVCVGCCVIYCGFCRFFERLRDSSECLAAKGGRSSPKSIFPALGNSLSANCILSGLIAPKIFFLRVIVVMWFAEPNRHKDCCKVVNTSSLDTSFFRSKRSCKQQSGAAEFNKARWIRLKSLSRFSTPFRRLFGT